MYPRALAATALQGGVTARGTLASKPRKHLCDFRQTEKKRARGGSGPRDLQKEEDNATEVTLSGGPVLVCQAFYVIVCQAFT
jgi:hypothetical protein